MSGSEVPGHGEFSFPSSTITRAALGEIFFFAFCMALLGAILLAMIGDGPRNVTFSAIALLVIAGVLRQNLPDEESFKRDFGDRADAASEAFNKAVGRRRWGIVAGLAVLAATFSLGTLNETSEPITASNEVEVTAPAKPVQQVVETKPEVDIEAREREQARENARLQEIEVERIRLEQEHADWLREQEQQQIAAQIATRKWEQEQAEMRRIVIAKKNALRIPSGTRSNSYDKFTIEGRIVLPPDIKLERLVVVNEHDTEVSVSRGRLRTDGKIRIKVENGGSEWGWYEIQLETNKFEVSQKFRVFYEEQEPEVVFIESDDGPEWYEEPFVLSDHMDSTTPPGITLTPSRFDSPETYAPEGPVKDYGCAANGGCEPTRVIDEELACEVVFRPPDCSSYPCKESPEPPMVENDCRLRPDGPVRGPTRGSTQ